MSPTNTSDPFFAADTSSPITLRRTLAPITHDMSPPIRCYIQPIIYKTIHSTVCRVHVMRTHCIRPVNVITKRRRVERHQQRHVTRANTLYSLRLCVCDRNAHDALARRATRRSRDSCVGTHADIFLESRAVSHPKQQRRC